MSPIKILDERGFESALTELTLRDKDLNFIVETFGKPPFWRREPGFATLVQIILEQQVSLASARSAYQKLLKRLKTLTPRKFLTLDEQELKQIGFSRQKAHYCRELAKTIESGEFDFDDLQKADDRQAMERLMSLKGIGTWTAEVYLLMALKRADIFPRKDLALAIAVKRLKKSESLPTFDELHELSQRWKPYRAVAARLLWHFYLSTV
ncbi:MAG: DNA-3-methyladenine glycosylase 2 family protein [Calditrichaeota bacterium]|nr:DNA-3-methyladenine glycosylase 2 family protein [Calditrichota bacterium]